MLCALSALRAIVCDAIMTTLGGARATTYSYNPPVLGAPASIIGSELPPLPRYGAPVLHFPRAGVPNLERLALSGWGEAFKNGHMAEAQTLGTTYNSA
jgi:hypothetical protein